MTACRFTKALALPSAPFSRPQVIATSVSRDIVLALVTADLFQLGWVALAQH